MSQSSIRDAAQKFLGDAYDPETGHLNLQKMQERALRERGKTNILLIGATGSGKSELTNAIFNKKVAEASHGEPVTQHLVKIVNPEMGLVLWDTRGIEAKNYEKSMGQLKKEIGDALTKAKRKDEFPHIALLCIRETSCRIEGREHALLEITKEFNIPVLVVFTDTRKSGGEFVETVKSMFTEKYGKHIKGYARVNSIPYEVEIGGDCITVPVSGIIALVDQIVQCLEDVHANAAENFAKIQRANTEKKLDTMTKGAKKIIHTAATLAGGAGASPIPGSDAPIIAAIQAGMIYKLNTEFEVSAAEAQMTSLITGILGTTAIANVGRAVVANLLKLIPAAGQLIGGAISGATAMTITEAIGLAYLEVLRHYFNKETGSVEFPKDFATILPLFTDIFQQRYKK